MHRQIRSASLCAAIAAAVLVGGTAQAYAAVASPARVHASASPAAQDGASASAIWRWAGRYDSFVEAQAAYYVLYGLGSAVAQLIEEVIVDGAKRWELYIQ
ncbi:hypothetical protein ACFVHI_29925 [Kitasatospora sp. NPDC127121]|uniref:hypothetical protein n=1 Tax=Kitasatospora sp. NPDC127121 TaxID=3345371 RepID=UPI003632DD18